MGNELQTAFINYKQGNYATAWDLCQHILKTTPTQPDCLAMLGMMSNKAERYAPLHCKLPIDNTFHKSYSREEAQIHQKRLLKALRGQTNSEGCHELGKHKAKSSENQSKIEYKSDLK